MKTKQKSSRYSKKVMLRRKGVLLKTSPMAKLSEGFRIVDLKKPLPKLTRISRMINGLKEFGKARVKGLKILKTT